VAWALFSKAARYMALSVSRTAREVVRRPQGRVECTVHAGFKDGKRWAEALGFSVETPVLRQYGPTGSDHVGYVRFNA
jgi:hypothetical protein